MLERSVDETAARARRRRGAPTGGCSSRSCATPTRSCGELLAPARARRATRCCWPLRPQRDPLRARPRALALRGRARPRAARRLLRALDAVAARAGQRRLRPRARAERPRGRLAGGARRLAAAGRRARRAPALARRDGSRPAARSSRSTSSAAPAPVLLDVTPRQLLALAGDRLPDRYRRALERYRYGPGVFKLDWALDGPIPWTAPEAARAGHGAPRRHARRDRRLRAGRGRRRAPRAAVRAAGAAQPVRPHPRARGQAHAPGPTATCRTARRAT